MIPCRILVIAPYESMKNILLFICKDRPEVRLTVMVGDLGAVSYTHLTLPTIWTV